MKRLLNYQADRIEMVLKSYKVPAKVKGGLVTPHFVQFHLLPQTGLKLSQLKNLAEEIALSLGCHSCRIYRQGGKLNLEIPRQNRPKISLLHLCRRLAHVPPCSPLLGLDGSGTPLLLHLPGPDVAHALISGSTGSGKTALAQTMIASLALFNRQSQLQLLLIDPKRRGFASFSSLPHLLCPPISSAQEASKALSRLVSEMERRDQAGSSLPRLVLFIDELADLLQTGGQEAQNSLTRLTQRGRSAGFHIVACTQKPTASAIGSLMKANFPARLVGSVSSAEEAKVAAGLPGTGAEKLAGRGDFILVVRGQISRFQAAYISEGEIATLLKGEAQPQARMPYLSIPELIRPERLLKGGRR